MKEPTHGIPAQTRGALIEELRNLAVWVRTGDYDLDDARDEIARAIENRIRVLRADTRRSTDVPK